MNFKKYFFCNIFGHHYPVNFEFDSNKEGEQIIQKTVKCGRCGEDILLVALFDKTSTHYLIKILEKY